MSDRKEVERRWYEERYGARLGLDSETIREGLLGSSESYYLMRMRALALPGVRVLEIGCGEGRLAIQCARGGASVTGIDISDNAIMAARESAERAGVHALTDFRVGDVEQLPFEDGSFDLVLNHEVLSSVVLEEVVAECRRVLRPGGIFLGIECLGHNPVFNLNRAIKARMGARTAWAVSHILRDEGLKIIEAKFSSCQVQYFHLMSALTGVPVLFMPRNWRKGVIAALERVDERLFRSSALRRQAFKVVYEAQA